MFVVVLGIAFLGGIVTAVSPCVFPVLPILLAGGASGGRRRAFAIVAGLVVSFSIFTLFAAWVLDRLGLPKDLLRNVAIAMLFVVAATLLFPQIARLVERPFQRLVRRGPPGQREGIAGGLVLGLSLGLVFVPCAGPVLTAITVQAASLDFGVRTVLLTVAYAVGAGLPMIAIAALGSRASERTRWLRMRNRRVQAALGIVVALATLAIVFNLDQRLQQWFPDYTSSLQVAEKSKVAKDQLGKLTGAGSGPSRAGEADPKKPGTLADYGEAPNFTDISAWLNSKPLAIKELRGKVVLIDFWTYSCINCLRTLSHVRGWASAYEKDGLVVVGVHTPELPFEKVEANVRRQVRDLGVKYPVVVDNDYAIWNAYRNHYWPAAYIVDATGHVRFHHFGEGRYEEQDAVVDQLLREAGR
jgi:cytochrome c biogenesis protein CcdA/thiol-disulfide isomerase/thioredoxin